jgi:hypothetical protein
VDSYTVLDLCRCDGRWYSGDRQSTSQSLNGWTTGGPNPWVRCVNYEQMYLAPASATTPPLAPTTTTTSLSATVSGPTLPRHCVRVHGSEIWCGEAWNSGPAFSYLSNQPYTLCQYTSPAAAGQYVFIVLCSRPGVFLSACKRPCSASPRTFIAVCSHGRRLVFAHSGSRMYAHTVWCRLFVSPLARYYDGYLDVKLAAESLMPVGCAQIGASFTSITSNHNHIQ